MAFSVAVFELVVVVVVVVDFESSLTLSSVILRLSLTPSAFPVTSVRVGSPTSAFPFVADALPNRKDE